MAALALFGAYGGLQVVLQDLGFDADAAHSLLIWTGVRQGGLAWLKDWQFGPDNWLLSLVPLNALAYAVVGPSPLAPVLYGWLVFVANAVLAAGVAWTLGARRAAPIVAVVMLNLGLYAHRFGFAAFAVSHNTTNAFGLGALWLGLIWFQRGSMPALLGAGLLLVCGSVSDPWMTASFLIPLALACALLAPWPAFRGRRGRLAGLFLISALALVAIETRLFGLLSFIPRLPVVFGTPQTMISNGLFTVRDLGALISIVPFQASDALRFGLISIAAAVAVLALLLRPLMRSPEVLTPPRLLVLTVAALSAAGVLGAQTAMATPVTEWSGRFLVNCLYLLAVTIGVLADLNWERLPRPARAACLAYGVLFVAVGALGTAARWTSPRFDLRDQDRAGEIAFLQSHGLTYGYGPYWGANANAATLLSRGRVIIRPAHFNPDGVMVFKGRTQTSLQWYTPADAPRGLGRWFVVIKSDGEECPDVAVCLSGVQRQFGAPVQTLDFAGARILVWDHPLIAYQSPPVPFAPGERIATNSAGVWAGHQGWSIPEPWGTWTEGPSAVLRLKTDRPLPSPARLIIEGHAFLAPDRLRAQEVEVVVDGRSAGALRYTLADNEGPRTIALPAGAGADGLLTIEFRIAHPTTPAAPGVAGDKRELGLGVEAVTVAAEPGRTSSG